MKSYKHYQQINKIAYPIMTHINSNQEADYNTFANLYNSHWGNSAERFMTALGNIAGNKLIEGSIILDLCCGTGQLAALLQNKGHSVTGIDCSSEMLTFARKNSPASEFLLQDARTFNLPSAFHFAVSSYDSLNHMTNEEDLLHVLQNVSQSLKPGGMFQFDLNMEIGYIKNWNSPFNVIEENHVLAVETQYNQENRIAEFNATLMTKEKEGWTRHDFQLLQRCYNATTVVDLLEAAGFIDIQIYSTDDDKHYRQYEEFDKRAFFLAAKPS